MKRVILTSILVLGIRKAESAARARTMARHEKGRVRERLSPNASLPNSLVYSPIEAWTNDEVWMFLMQIPNAWGPPNKDGGHHSQLRRLPIRVLDMHTRRSRQIDVRHDSKRRREGMDASTLRTAERA